ncbi:pentatricopeptide repeat-containing protein mitochondrial [Gossypium australe]|uniref:Pentatricopeptide repeat-containing protein mitochondrial n=1 Tax=Gossypium australe TaxID=47621 RepID=A0A5B6V023_9ROSI|nr:pentatricopeptide repeat-containing protein mitochondrial [Gossypium australe]
MKDEALALFKLMDELKLIHSDLPLNDLMQLYLKLGQPENVPELIDELKRRNIPRSSYTYGFLLWSYAELNDMEGVERVVEELSNNVEENCTWIECSTLAAIYVQANQFEKAEAFLRKLESDKMPRKHEAYHSLISLYAGTLNRAEVYQVCEAMKRVWEYSCSVYDMRLADNVIHGYLSGDLLEEAELVFDKAMKRCKGPFAISWERFMVYYLKKLRIDLALKHMEAAVILKNNSPLDSNAYGTLLKAYIVSGKVAPNMWQRLAKDGIELSQELQDLLVNVCPE